MSTGFSLFKRNKKQRVIDKIYNSFYVKEVMLEEFTLDERKFDCLVVCSFGIFIFRIYEYKNEIVKKDNTYYVEDKNTLETIRLGNPKIELEKDADIVKSYVGNYPIFKIIIVDHNKNKELQKKYNVQEFRRSIAYLNKVLDNETINNVSKEIKHNIKKEEKDNG